MASTLKGESDAVTIRNVLLWMDKEPQVRRDESLQVGHVVIEIHKGKPIVPKEVLERYYPNALTGISRPSRSIRIKDTTIVFVEFSEQIQFLGEIEFR